MLNLSHEKCWLIRPWFVDIYEYAFINFICSINIYESSKASNLTIPTEKNSLNFWKSLTIFRKSEKYTLLLHTDIDMYWTYLRPMPVKLRYTFSFMRKKTDIHYLLCDRENLNKENELLESSDHTREIFLACNVKTLGIVIFEIDDSLMCLCYRANDRFSHNNNVCFMF